MVGTKVHRGKGSIGGVLSTGPNTQGTNRFGLQLQLQLQSASDSDEMIDDGIGQFGIFIQSVERSARSLLNGMDSLLGLRTRAGPAVGGLSWGPFGGLGRFWVVEVNETA